MRRGEDEHATQTQLGPDDRTHRGGDVTTKPRNDAPAPFTSAQNVPETP